jgi:hypothetical protein
VQGCKLDAKISQIEALLAELQSKRSPIEEDEKKNEKKNMGHVVSGLVRRAIASCVDNPHTLLKDLCATKRGLVFVPLIY